MLEGGGRDFDIGRGAFFESAVLRIVLHLVQQAVNSVFLGIRLPAAILVELFLDLTDRVTLCSMVVPPSRNSVQFDRLTARGRQPCEDVVVLVPQVNVHRVEVLHQGKLLLAYLLLRFLHSQGSSVRFGVLKRLVVNQLRFPRA